MLTVNLLLEQTRQCGCAAVLGISTGRWDRIGKARKKIEASSYLNPLKDLLKYFGDGSSGVLHPPNNTMAATKPARMIMFFIMLRRLNPQPREVSTSLSVGFTVPPLTISSRRLPVPTRSGSLCPLSEYLSASGRVGPKWGFRPRARRRLSRNGRRGLR